MTTAATASFPAAAPKQVSSEDHEQAVALVQRDPFAGDLVDRLSTEFGFPAEFAQDWVTQAQSWARSQGATEAAPDWVFPILLLSTADRAEAFEGLAEVITGVDWSTYLIRFCAADPVNAPDQAQQMR